jgi:hypothetical protein
MPLHRRSLRIDCAAQSETDLDSELNARPPDQPDADDEQR